MFCHGLILGWLGSSVASPQILALEARRLDPSHPTLILSCDKALDAAGVRAQRFGEWEFASRWFDARIVAVQQTCVKADSTVLDASTRDTYIDNGGDYVGVPLQQR